MTIRNLAGSSKSELSSRVRIRSKFTTIRPRGSLAASGRPDVRRPDDRSSKTIKITHAMHDFRESRKVFDSVVTYTH